MSHYILKVECSDKAGLIYHLSEVIYQHGMNIEKNSEFVDKEYERFFFRAVISGDVDLEKLRFDLTRMLPEDATIELHARRKKNLVLLATKESHCLGDILIRYHSGELDANILAVISNHDSLRDLSERFGIPYFYVSAENLAREDHEDKIKALLHEFNPDIIVLAKYMRILSPNFVKPFAGKIINIHHSFLPAFIGANPYKQAFERGVKIIGATAHYVNDDLDEGPIIAQDVVSVTHEYGWRDMQKAGRNVEKIVLSKAIDLALDDRVFVYENKTVIF
jgi:formyltetrahydrofolate deformylase